MNLEQPLHAIRTRIEQSPLAQRFLSGAFWSVFGSVVTNGASLVMTMIVARILGRGPFGHYITIQTTLAAATAFSWFGIGYAATRYAAELHRRDPARLGRILGLSEVVVVLVGVGVMGVLFLGSDWLALRALNAPDLGPMLAVASIATIFSSFDGYQKSVLIGMSEIRAFASGSILVMVAAFPVTVGLTYFYGLDGATAAIVLSAVANCFVSRVQMRASLAKFNIRTSLAGSMKEKNTLFHFVFPALLSGLLPSLSQWAVQSMLARACGYGEVAIFGVAMQWFYVVNFLPTTIARALMPMLTDFVTDKDHRNSRRFLLLGIGVSVLAALPVALLGVLFSPYVMASYGSQFAGADAALTITMAIAVLHGVQNSVQNFIAAKEQMWTGIAMTAALMAIFVSASSVLVDRGAFGTALALAIAYLLQMVWVFSYAWAFVRR